MSGRSFLSFRQRLTRYRQLAVKDWRDTIWMLTGFWV